MLEFNSLTELNAYYKLYGHNTCTNIIDKYSYEHTIAFVDDIFFFIELFKDHFIYVYLGMYPNSKRCTEYEILTKDHKYKIIGKNTNVYFIDLEENIRTAFEKQDLLGSINLLIQMANIK